jgi:DNA-binding NarL/FixJ family response regulator
MSDTIHVAIADDHALFREGLAAILAAEEDIDVVGQAGNAQEAIQLASSLLPDIMLLDIDMPGNGLWAAQVIAEQCPITRIVVLTASEDDDNLMNALTTGARGYILKGVVARELTRILRAVYAGESYVPPSLAASLLMEMQGRGSRGKQPADPVSELTERERQILEGLASGLSNKEIGQKYFLSENTVKHYVTNILQKLQVRNRVEAALLAHKSGQVGKGEQKSLTQRPQRRN